MSAAAATADVARPGKRGKKKLIVIAVVVLVVLLLLAGGGLYWLKAQRAAQAAADEAAEEAATTEVAAAPKVDAAHPPTFLPLETFVVNLADKEADRYAQVGITLEMDPGPAVDQMKAYMPAVRNAILMILAHKTSAELLDRAGKEQLADEIMREAVRPMGIDIPAPRPVTAASDAGRDDEVAARPKARAKGKGAPRNPIHHVHFSSFIIQ